jgi:aryl-alcohol dehydrogenase-like predicted oxidoreductase
MGCGEEAELGMTNFSPLDLTHTVDTLPEHWYYHSTTQSVVGGQNAHFDCQVLDSAKGKDEIMEYRQLGKTALKVSSIGLGCVTFGREIDEATSFAVMDHAVSRGINLLDTAEAYGGGASETTVGKWLKSSGKRDQVVVCTKVSGNLTSERILTSAEASLRRLNVDSVDLFQLHRFDPTVPLEEMLEALNQLVEKGYARYIGCSNFAAWQLAKSLWKQDVNGWARLESVQPIYNLVDRNIERELIPLCVDQQVGIISYSPLGAGFLTGKYQRDAEVPKGTRFEVIPGHQPLYFTETGWRVVDSLRAKAAETGISMIDLALAWTIGQPGITCVLVGARGTEQVDQAFNAEAVVMSNELRGELSKL